jgi:ABC-2 type transport system ATP-binding protein
VEVAGRNKELDPAIARERLERVSGVSRVTFKSKRENRSLFEVETRKGSTIRGDVARAVVEAGWDLNELRPSAVSLEEVFLQLTGESAAAAPGPEPEAVTVGAK